MDRPGAGLGFADQSRLALRERRVGGIVHGDRRLKYPMKLVNGQWTKVSWQQAIDEIGDKQCHPREVWP